MDDAVAVGRVHAVGHEEPTAGPRKGYIKLAGILHILLLVAVVGIGITPIDGIEDDDVVVLQSLGLVDSRHINPLADAPAIAEITFLQRAEIDDIALELSVETIDHFLTGQQVHHNVATDIVQLRYLVHLVLLDKIGISSPQFLHEGRLIGVGLQIIASCHGIQIQVAIVGAEFAGKGAHALMGQGSVWALTLLRPLAAQ